MQSASGPCSATTLVGCFKAVRDLRRSGVEAPLVFLSYYNPILAMGLQRFAGLAAEAVWTGDRP